MLNNKLQTVHEYVLPTPNKKYKYKLDMIENQFGPHPGLFDTLTAAIKTGINLYPINDDTQTETINKIVSYIGNEVKPENILITHGSDNALKLACETYNSPKMNVLVLYPTYPHFINFISLVDHNKINYLNITYEEDEDVIFNKIKQELKKEEYHLVYLVSPNLPIGYCLSSKQLNELCNINKETMFLVDEAYIEFSLNDTCAYLIRSCENIIVVRTFSKFFGIPSLRIGYICTAEKNIKNLRVSYNGKDVTNISKIAAMSVIDNKDHYQKNVQIWVNCKSLLQTRFNLLKHKYPNSFITGYSMRQGMFFLLFSKDSDVLARLFEQKGIIIRNKHSDIPFSCRISLPTIPMLEEILDICEEINKKYNEKYFDIKDVMCDTNKNIIFDLDGTLRSGSHWSTPIVLPQILKKKGHSVYIVTNNTSHSPLEICNHTGVNKENIFSPITNLDKFIKNKKDASIYVIGNQETINCIADQGFNIKTNDGTYKYILIANSYFLTGEQWIIISKNINSTFIICDDSDFVSVKHCSDVKYEQINENIIIPDLGSYIKIIKQLNPDAKLEYIGKPYVGIVENISNVKNSVIVGDSIKSDIQLAHNIGCYPVLISQKDSHGYNLLYDCFVINSLDQLSDN